MTNDHMGSLFGFWGFSFLTTYFVQQKNSKIKGVFLHFHTFLYGN
jgi:hypothetical protein